MSSDQIIGAGVNCTSPEHIESLLEQLPPSMRERKAVVVYPNSGAAWDKKRKEYVLDHLHVQYISVEIHYVPNVNIVLM